MTFSIPQTELPLEVANLLFVSWVTHLSQTQLGVDQFSHGQGPTGTMTYTFGNPTAAHFILELDRTGTTWSLAEAVDLDERQIYQITGDAQSKMVAGDYGPDIVYRTQIRTRPINIASSEFSLAFMRLLGDQVRITGSRRLGDRVLLEFKEDCAAGSTEEQPLLLAPDTTIEATLIVPGPTHGGLSHRAANGLAEVVAAICALALGRAVDVDPILFPVDENIASWAKEHQMDQEIPGLARTGVSLDLFGDFCQRSGRVRMFQLRNSLLTYHTALRQSGVDAATQFYVSTIESLLPPIERERGSATTQRFINESANLWPDKIDELVNHANTEEAFGLRLRGGPQRKRKQLMSRIYALRSSPAHEGVGLSAQSIMVAMGSAHMMRVALLSDLAMAAVLAFYKSTPPE